MERIAIDELPGTEPGDGTVRQSLAEPLDTANVAINRTGFRRVPASRAACTLTWTRKRCSSSWPARRRSRRSTAR